MSDTAYPVFQHYGTNAQRLAFTPSPAATGQPIYLWYETDTGSTYLYDTSWHLLAAPSGVTTTGSPATGQRAQFSGASSITGINAASRPQGRLTLTTAVPWLSASVTAATTIYYTPAEGNIVPIYNGTNWADTAFTELSQATTDNTKSPAACTTNSNYDLFVWSDGGTLRCTRGPLWTSDTARGTGAGTTELEYVNGILMNKVAITNGPGADRGTYVGTIRTNGSSQVDMIFGGSGGAGGESSIVGIWNMYNRRLITVVNFDNTDSWNYTTLTWRLKNAAASATANRILFVVGYQGDGISAINNIGGSNSSAGVIQSCAVGLNSTSAPATGSGIGAGSSSSANRLFTAMACYGGMAPLGLNYVAPLEISTASGVSTWYGDNGGGATIQLEASFIMTTMF